MTTDNVIYLHEHRARREGLALAAEKADLTTRAVILTARKLSTSLLALDPIEKAAN